MFKYKKNYEIRTKNVRVIGIEYILTLKEAIKIAIKDGLDLVEINPNNNPPICKLVNFNKYIYEKNKRIKENKKKQKKIQKKEIKIRPSTEERDYQIKLRNIIKFIQLGYKVKVTMQFRGREIIHYNLGVKILQQIKEDLKNIAIIESFPNKIESKQIYIIFIPYKK